MPKKINRTKAEQSHRIYISREYYSDLSKNGMLYGALVRSPQANIRITNIDLSILPQDYYFFTSRDIPGKNLIKTLDTETKVFCDDTVHYAGEPVGIICGSNLEKVKQLAQTLALSFSDPDNKKDSFPSEQKLLSSRIIKTGLFKNIPDIDSTPFNEDFLSNLKKAAAEKTSEKSETAVNQQEKTENPEKNKSSEISAENSAKVLSEKTDLIEENITAVPDTKKAENKSNEYVLSENTAENEAASANELKTQKKDNSEPEVAAAATDILVSETERLSDGFKTENTASSDTEKLSSSEFEKTKEAEKPEEIEEPFPEENKTFYSTWSEKEFIPDWNETTGAFCFMDGYSLTVMAPTKWPSHLKQALQDVLALNDEKIIIKKTQIQKSNFNGTWRTSTIAVQTALACFLTGKPVLLSLSNDEQKAFIDNGITLKITHKSSVDSEKKIKSLAINIEADAGYENPYTKEFIDRLVLASVSVYNPENLYIRAQVFNSQNPPTSVYPEIIDSTGYGAIETHIHKISRELHTLPDEFRRLNISGKNRKLYVPFNYKLTNELDILNPVIKQSSFNRKYAVNNLSSEYLLSNTKDAFYTLDRHGTGLSFAIDGSGYYGSSIFNSAQNMETTLELNGTFTIHSPVPSPVVSEIWKNICAEILQIKPESVNITNELPEDQIPDLPENVYNNVSVMTQLLKKCCQDIQKKRFLSPLPIHSAKNISSSMKRNWNKEKFSGVPFHTTSYGGAIVEIEFNPQSYAVTIKEIWVVIDCGNILSMKAAENAIKLGIQKELKNLITDEELYCEKINITFVQSSPNPGQIGEIIHSLIPPAFANAVNQILCTNIPGLPISRQKLYSIYTDTARKHKRREDSENEKLHQAEENEVARSIMNFQKPLEDIINRIEEKENEQAKISEEEFQEKARQISEADDKAIQELIEKDKKEQQ